MIDNKKKEVVKTVVLHKGDKSRYLISSLQYELRMLKKMKIKSKKRKAKKLY